MVIGGIKLTGNQPAAIEILRQVHSSTRHHIQPSIETAVSVYHPASSLHWYSVALSLYRDKWITTIPLWWLSQWLVIYGHHLAVTIIYMWRHLQAAKIRLQCLRNRGIGRNMVWCLLI